jgi:hypothetical protein
LESLNYRATWLDLRCSRSIAASHFWCSYSQWVTRNRICHAVVLNSCITETVSIFKHTSVWMMMAPIVSSSNLINIRITFSVETKYVNEYE